MIAIVLAVATAAGWGASDYFGGDASRRDTPVFVVVALAQLVGLALLAPVLIGRGVAPPPSPRLLLAAVSGVAVTAELGLIYRALSRGDAFITAPVGALGAAGAVTIGLIGGDPLDAAIALGLCCALGGGAVSAWTSPTAAGGHGRLARAAATCVAAAAAVAVMLVCLHGASRVDPYWATATEHVSTALSAGLVAFAGRRRSPGVRLPRLRQWPALALVGAAGAGGDVAYATASQHGALSVISAISSLYPVTTIILAGMLRHRRASRVQVLGITLALAGAVLLGAAAR